MNRKRRRRNKTIIINILCLLAGVGAGILVVAAGTQAAGLKASKQHEIMEAAVQPQTERIVYRKIC